MQSTHEIERTLAAWALGGIAISIIGTLLGLYILYWVIRVAVRDGFTDAQRQLRPSRPTRELRDGLRTTTPDMRAD